MKQTTWAHLVFLGDCSSPFPWAPAASLTLQQESPSPPIFWPRNVSSHPLWNFPLFLSTRVRHTFPILPSSPFHKSIHQHHLWFHIHPFPLPPEGPHVPQSVAGAFLALCCQLSDKSNAHTPRHCAKYLHVGALFTDSKWRRRNVSLCGFALPPNLYVAFLHPRLTDNHIARNVRLKTPYNCH